MTVLREDDPRVPTLLADGWRIAHRSWGARLRHPDAARLAELAAGHDVAEVGPDLDASVAALEGAVRGDYPGGATTAPDVHDAAALQALRAGGTRFFAVLEGHAVVAVTAIRRGGERAETDFTAVARTHRRRGLAEAVKAASVLALLAEGVVVFGTGGADENAASLAMNARLGYVVEERWLTLEHDPVAEGSPSPDGWTGPRDDGIRSGPSGCAAG